MPIDMSSSRICDVSQLPRPSQLLVRCSYPAEVRYVTFAFTYSIVFLSILLVFGVNYGPLVSFWRRHSDCVPQSAPDVATHCGCLSCCVAPCCVVLRCVAGLILFRIWLTKVLPGQETGNEYEGLNAANSTLIWTIDETHWASWGGGYHDTSPAPETATSRPPCRMLPVLPRTRARRHAWAVG